jgi:hypothetical protein
MDPCLLTTAWLRDPWRRLRMRVVVPALLLILAISPPTLAQQSPPLANEDRELIQRLLQRVNELEAQVKELQAERAKSAPPAAPPVPPAPEVAAPEEQVRRQLREESRGLQIRGFGDLAFRTSDRKGSTSSFALGQLDLFITSRLSDKLSVLNENVLAGGLLPGRVVQIGRARVAHAQGEGPNAVGIDVERLLLQYSLNEYLNIAFGRYHTSIGYYNTAYHHGAWLETATGHPFLFLQEHDGGILPMHNVGLSFTGSIPSGSLGLRYVFEIGNGRTSRSSTDEAVQNVVDENNGKSLNFGLIARPDQAPGLQVGVSVYRDKLRPEQLPSIQQTITAAHLIYLTPSFEWLNEGILVRHSPRGARRSFNTPGFYTQMSRQFGRFRPYFRYQWINAPKDEPIFPEVGLLHGPSLGVRYDLDESTALKMQYDHTDRRGRSSFNELTLQTAFTF